MRSACWYSAAVAPPDSIAAASRPDWGAALRDESGMAVRFAGSHTDITVRVALGTFLAALAFVLVRPHLNLG